MVANNKAFTIIEFLIIIGLIGIMTTVSIAAYSSFNESSKLKSEAQRFVAILTLAQKRAVSGDLAQCSGCTQLNNYSVNWSSTSSYTLKGNADSTPSVDFGAQTYSIDPTSQNIVVQNNFGTITFNTLNGSTQSAINQVATFKNNVTNYCVSVTVTPAGLISSTAPVAC